MRGEISFGDGIQAAGLKYHLGDKDLLAKGSWLFLCDGIGFRV